MSSPTSPRADPNGFSLIEVLVALMVLAVASVGLIGATEAYIDTVDAAEKRALAQWVAENKIVELTVSGELPKAQELIQSMGRTWKVQVATRPSTDTALLAHELYVSEPNSDTPIIAMDFFTPSGEVQ
ncbi:MAG TPA: type II secretion system minor pseudopilin GspI [Allosphingosinicella sp.]|nr:type II secretion system minor pseudopilin GspI [Allosphingosinicella sp.]